MVMSTKEPASLWGHNSFLVAFICCIESSFFFFRIMDCRGLNHVQVDLIVLIFLNVVDFSSHHCPWKSPLFFFSSHHLWNAKRLVWIRSNRRRNEFQLRFRSDIQVQKGRLHSDPCWCNLSGWWKLVDETITNLSWWVDWEIYSRRAALETLCLIVATM